EGLRGLCAQLVCGLLGIRRTESLGIRFHLPERNRHPLTRLAVGEEGLALETFGLPNDRNPLLPKHANNRFDLLGRCLNPDDAREHRFLLSHHPLLPEGALLTSARRECLPGRPSGAATGRAAEW